MVSTCLSDIIYYMSSESVSYAWGVSEHKPSGELFKTSSCPVNLNKLTEATSWNTFSSINSLDYLVHDIDNTSSLITNRLNPGCEGLAKTSTPVAGLTRRGTQFRRPETPFHSWASVSSINSSDSRMGDSEVHILPTQADFRKFSGNEENFTVHQFLSEAENYFEQAKVTNDKVKVGLLRSHIETGSPAFVSLEFILAVD